MRRAFLLIFFAGCTYGPPPQVSPPVVPSLLGCEGGAPKPAHCPAPLVGDACTNSASALGPAVAFNCPGDGMTSTVVADMVDAHEVFRRALEWIDGSLRASGQLTADQERFSTGTVEFTDLNAPPRPAVTPSTVPVPSPGPSSGVRGVGTRGR